MIENKINDIKERFSRLYKEIHDLRDYLIKEYGIESAVGREKTLAGVNELAWETQEELIKWVRRK